MKQFQALVLAGCSALALGACGADDVVAPGGPIIVNPAPTPTPTPTGTPGGSVTAAATCTPGTTDGGTVALQNNRGTIRNCVVPNAIAGTVTLSGRRADGIMYSLNGRTDVGRDIDLAGGAAATLNILPGVTVFAATRESNLIVNRGSRLNADGTAAQPIIFTALANLTGSGITERTDNLWGGLIINGRAPVSDCDPSVSPSTVGGSAGCWRKAEGVSVDTLFGGNIANDNSGILRYVQVNFTGVGSGGSEIQGITTGGVGSGTTMSYLQIHNSLDDGIESFGGTQNMDHLILTGIADDSLDTDNGYIGSVQFVFAARRAGGTVGDAAGAQTMLEIDSSAANDAAPRQYLKLANFTLLQNSPNEPAIRLRGGADVDFVNGIIVARSAGTNGCLDVDNAETVQAAGAYNGTPDRGPPRFLSVVFDCDVLIDPDSDTFEETALSNAANSNVNRAFTNTLQFLTGSTVGRVANGANETAVVAATSLGSIASFLQQVNYIGAFSGPADVWTRDWTCNSDVADLRGGLACIDVRVF
ncbi:hypothetical protein ACWPM1_12335 [Tsuneonella sp. HG249]